MAAHAVLHRAVCKSTYGTRCGSVLRKCRAALSSRGVEFCRPEEGVGQRPGQILESKPDRVQGASHSLARINTDRGTQAIGESPGHRGRLVDVAVEGYQGAMGLEELANLAGADVDFAVNQIESGPEGRAVGHTDERCAIGAQFAPDRLEIGPDPFLPFAPAKIERVNRAVLLAPEAIHLYWAVEPFLPAFPILERERCQAHRAEPRDPRFRVEPPHRAVDVVEALDARPKEHGEVRTP